MENSVASELSNGFVEGTDSKLKMVKRTMSEMQQSTFSSKTNVCEGESTGYLRKNPEFPEKVHYLNGIYKKD